MKPPVHQRGQRRTDTTSPGAGQHPVLADGVQAVKNKPTVTGMRIFLGVVAISLLTACAPLRVKQEVLLPAREDGLLNARRVAVLDFEQERRSFFSGGLARSARAEIEAMLGGVRTGGRPQFDLIERSRIDDVTRELVRSHGSPLFDEQSAVRLGRLVGADTVLMGMLSGPWTDSRHYTVNYQECGRYEGRKCVYQVSRPSYCQQRAISLKLTLRAVSVESGRIVFAKTYSSTADDDSCKSAFSSSTLESRALAAVVGEARRDLVMHTETLAVELMEKPDTELKGNRGARKLFESGVEFAKAQRMDRACEQFTQALAKGAASPVLYYNAGVCAEFEGNPDKALVFYRQADRRSDTPVRQYGEALARIQKRLDADRQMRDRDETLR